MDGEVLLYAVGLVAGIAVVIGLVLAFADSKLAVADDPRVVAVEEMLAGYNCGACGTPSCNAFANALVEGKVHESGCKPNSKENELKITNYRKKEGF